MSGLVVLFSLSRMHGGQRLRFYDGLGFMKHVIVDRDETK